MHTATLTIQLGNSESADEAVVNYVINRGLFTPLLRRYWGDPWHIDANRMADIAERIGALIPKGHRLTIHAGGDYELVRENVL